MRDLGPTEVTGFGICAEPDNLTYVTDFKLVKQRCGRMVTSIDDDGLIDHAFDMDDLGLHPQQSAQIWIHTHPNIPPTPSSMDEHVFDKAVGTETWAIMFIISTTGETYCRFRNNNGPKISYVLEVKIDWEGDFPAANTAAWVEEYLANVSWYHFDIPGRDLVRGNHDGWDTDYHFYGDRPAPRKSPNDRKPEVAWFAEAMEACPFNPIGWALNNWGLQHLRFGHHRQELYDVIRKFDDDEWHAFTELMDRYDFDEEKWWQPGTIDDGAYFSISSLLREEFSPSEIDAMPDFAPDTVDDDVNDEITDEAEAERLRDLLDDPNPATDPADGIPRLTETDTRQLGLELEGDHVAHNHHRT